MCTRVGAAERNYLDTVVEFAEDAQFVRAYQRSTGLCVPHLLAAVERNAGASGLEPILRTTLAKWQDLRGDLARFVSKHEYRNAEPITEEEAASYHRAGEVLAGRRGLFANDVRRGETH